MSCVAQRSTTESSESFIIRSLSLSKCPNSHSFLLYSLTVINTSQLPINYSHSFINMSSIRRFTDSPIHRRAAPKSPPHHYQQNVYIAGRNARNTAGLSNGFRVGFDKLLASLSRDSSDRSIIKFAFDFDVL